MNNLGQNMKFVIQPPPSLVNLGNVIGISNSEQSKALVTFFIENCGIS